MSMNIGTYSEGKMEFTPTPALVGFLSLLVILGESHRKDRLDLD